MGKYLQDFMYSVEFLKGQTILSQEQKDILKSCKLIEDLFNLYLPKKFEIGGNIWRIIIKLDIAFNNSKDIKVNEFGNCLDSYIYYDFNQLKDLNIDELKLTLLNFFVKGIENCLDLYYFDFGSLKKIQEKIISDKVVFDDFYKGNKVSPDKKYYAQMKGFYSEDYESRKLYVIIYDKSNNMLQSILVGNYDFRAFDHLKWIDNKNIGVYHINNIQSYKRKKVALDYFIINIETGIVTYNPVTRESIFDFGIKLLTETDDYNKAIGFIRKAKNLGHGKADNILRNLEINTEQRDKAILLQTPKRKNGR